jgi:SHS2 domain-containing protein
MAWGSQFLRKDQWEKPLWGRGPFRTDFRDEGPFSLLEGEKGFLVKAVNLETLFISAASMLFHHVTEKTTNRGVHALNSRTVEVDATSPAGLLGDWLNVLLVLFHRQGMVCGEYELIDISERHLEAVVSGDEYNPRSHQLHLLIKRVLADKLRLQKTNGFWHAVIVYET